MSCNCSSTPCSTPTVQINSCEGCTYTVNTDCVIYKGDRLSFESGSVTDGSARTLSSLLEAIENIDCCSRPAKIVQFSVEGVSSYTLEAEDVNKILLLTQFDDGVAGTITNTIVLPSSLDFVDREIIIKDIATPVDPNVTNIEYLMSPTVQIDWAPAASENDFHTLATGDHRTLRLRFVKTTPTAYQWIVVD